MNNIKKILGLVLATTLLLGACSNQSSSKPNDRYNERFSVPI